MYNFNVVMLWMHLGRHVSIEIAGDSAGRAFCSTRVGVKGSGRDSRCIWRDTCRIKFIAAVLDVPFVRRVSINGDRSNAVDAFGSTRVELNCP